MQSVFLGGFFMWMPSFCKYLIPDSKVLSLALQPPSLILLDPTHTHTCGDGNKSSNPFLLLFQAMSPPS